jgi:hypothetical protein
MQLFGLVEEIDSALVGSSETWLIVYTVSPTLVYRWMGVMN